ncbi:MAG: metallophosphoesterase, partial [Herbinix sp.]|nr:metallophosphoesterase [Herbinix sp.]
MKSKKNSGKGRKVLLSSICGTLALTSGAFIMFFPVTYKIDRSLVMQNTEYNVVKVDGEYNSLAKVDAFGNYLDDDFKIVAFTDMHLDTYKAKGNVTIEMLVRNISSQKPDLVVFVGDNVTSALNARRVKQLGKLMEELGVYWTLVLGNHEGDNNLSISRQKMIDIFASYPHCLVEADKKVTKSGEALWGVGNHVINLLDSKGEIRQSLYFFDSGADMTEEDIENYKEEIESTNKRTDDYIKDSQIQWYKETVSNINNIAKKTVKSVIFSHIPLVEFNTAYEKAIEEHAEAELLHGTKLETVCSSGHNNGLFEVIQDLGSTQAFVSGHDHVNNFAVKYKGIILAYNQNSGYSSYNIVTKKKSDTLIQGFTAYT